MYNHTMEQQINSRFESRLIENREVRIFLSSTFSDMEAERSALVKLFNKLKLEAIRRNISLSLLDLRWGVTSEESRTGKVLSVCLNEIENSRPFFIGLLGSRYGYSPKKSELEKNPELEERYPWLSVDIAHQLSITEIEMQYGALRNQDKVDAVFFIKDTPDTLPDDDKKLSSLKSKILEQERFPVVYYHSVDDLCVKVEKQIVHILDQYFPPKTYTRLELTRNAQRAYINRHSFYKKYHKDYRMFKWFMAQPNTTRLVIMGGPGAGKSALLANWVKEAASKGDTFSHHIIYHFIGNSFSNNKPNDILQHICEEIYDLYDIKHEKQNGESLKDEAQRLLIEAGQKGKPLLIVIDGINQLENDGNSEVLEWMPQAPETTKYILSCQTNTPLADIFCGKDGYYCHWLEQVDEGLRREFVIDYLAHVGKKLNDAQLQRVVQDSENENMLVLKTLLDELISFGSYERLDEFIDYYLSAPSIEAFFDRLLQRMERDYVDVPHLLSLIDICILGLSDEEILTLTGLRPVDFYLFYGAFCNHFTTQDGRILFSHQFIEKAVHTRYGLESCDSSRSYYEELIRFFTDNQEIECHRRIIELAHLYYQIGDHQKLHDTICNVEAFELFIVSEGATNTFLKYWRLLLNTESCSYKLTEYLHLDFNAPSCYASFGQICNTHFADYDLSLEALHICLKKTLEANEELSIPVANAYINIANLYSTLNRDQEALTLSEKALNIQRRILGDKNIDVATSYSNIGCLYASMGKLRKALHYQATAIEIAEETLTDGHPSLVQFYYNIGSTFLDLGKRKTAFDYYQRAFEIVESNYGSSHLKTADALLYIGDGYYAYHYILEARYNYLKALEIITPIFGKNHPRVADCYRRLGSVYCDLNEYEQSKDYLQKALGIYKDKLGLFHQKVASVYELMGLVAHMQGNKKEGLYYEYRSLVILKETFSPTHYLVAHSYNSIGFSHLFDGNIKKALHCFLETIRIKVKKHCQ